MKAFLLCLSLLSTPAFASVQISGDALGCAGGKQAMVAVVTVNGVPQNVVVDCGGGTAPVQTPNGPNCTLWSVGCETGGPGQISVDCEDGQSADFPLACQ